jgi:uncharacterized membrane protein required for colicin V production
MSIIFSIVLIAIVAIFAVLGAKKGFFKSVSGLISPLLALIITVLFYKPIAAWIKTWSFIAKMITPNVALPDLSGAEDLMGKLQILMKYLIVNEDTIDETAKAVASNVMAEVLSIAIAFIGLFVVSLIAIKLIFKVLDLFAQAPVIKQANGFLGGVVGACEGFIWCWTFCSQVSSNGRLPVRPGLPSLDRLCRSFSLCGICTVIKRASDLILDVRASESTSTTQR